MGGRIGARMDVIRRTDEEEVLLGGMDINR
jgi:hypothetical protein